MDCTFILDSEFDIGGATFFSVDGILVPVDESATIDGTMKDIGKYLLANESMLDVLCFVVNARTGS